MRTLRMEGGITMDSKEEYRIENAAVTKYGTTSQLRQLQEECAELIAAISHYLRGRQGSYNELIEEIADVDIMIKQANIALSPFDIESQRIRKLVRLRQRLYAEEK